ncbi:MAG: DNA gyrase subunit A [Acidimicrobiales bacterium]
MSDTLPPDGSDRTEDEQDGAGQEATAALATGSIEPIELQEEMERSFLDYAMSVIVSRALPDARDGLKPVHRRILYDMHLQGYRPDRPHVKCAKVTGDTMSRFHPHGNSAIYDALVRMAQPFSLRHPLIDFHGNYGSPDFPPAAERYTECRLAPLAMRMLDSIDEDTVDMGRNYTNEEDEPFVLPARFPNLLVNGSQGIAVGMATNIPPHNLGEVVDATIHLIDHPESTPDDLMHFVKGPDFPTGAFILGRAGIMDAYRTGRGSIRMRARAEIVEGRTGEQIVVTELPYQASMNAITQRIAELVNSRELEGIRSLDDLSAGDYTKLVIGLKRDANANVVLNNLWKLTPLQTSFGVNMVALVDVNEEGKGVPRTLNLVQALQAYVDHQVDVITRRSRFRLRKAQDRAHLVEGLLRALNMIDAIIALIRSSEDAQAAREGLMVDPFSFSEAQAVYILDMQLRRLTRLARIDLETELAGLQETITELERILNDPVVLRGVIKDELTAVRDQFATPRKAEITYDPGDIGAEDLIEDEDLVLTFTRGGYIKTMPASTFRVQGRGGRGVQGTKVKEDDIVSEIIHTTAHSYILFFSNRGRVFRIKAWEIPQKERTARGTAVVNLLPLAPEERIQAIVDTRDFPADRYLFFATRMGQVKKTAFSEYDKSRREGFIAISLRDGDELTRVITTTGADDVFMVSRQGMTIRFTEEDVRAMGRDAAGVRGMALRAGDEVVSCDVAKDDVAILMVTDNGFGKRTQLQHFNRQGRGGQGVRGIRVTAKRGVVVAAFMVGLDDEVLLISSAGVTIRMPVREIASQGRDATGVKVMNLDEGQTVAAVAPVLSQDDTDGS